VDLRPQNLPLQLNTMCFAGAGDGFFATNAVAQVAALMDVGLLRARTSTAREIAEGAAGISTRITHLCPSQYLSETTVLLFVRDRDCEFATFRLRTDRMEWRGSQSQGWHAKLKLDHVQWAMQGFPL
jgi:hypothetical protein